MNIIELASQSMELLRRLLNDALEQEPLLLKPDDESRRRCFIFHHARYIRDIGEDVFFLYQQGRYPAAVVSIRAMLESAFCVVAAVEDDAFAAEKIVAENEKYIKNLNAHFKDELSEPHIQQTLFLFDLLAKELRRRHNITSNSDWNTYDVAQAAKLKDMYKDYVVLCSYVHSSFGGIVAQNTRLSINNALRLAIASVIFACSFAPRVLKTKDGQTYIDRSNELAAIMQELIKTGAFEAQKRQKS